MPPASQPLPYQAAPRKNNNGLLWGIIIGSIVVATAAIVILAIMLWPKDSQPVSETSSYEPARIETKLQSDVPEPASITGFYSGDMDGYPMTLNITDHDPSTHAVTARYKNVNYGTTSLMKGTYDGTTISISSVDGVGLILVLNTTGNSLRGTGTWSGRTRSVNLSK